MTTYTAHTDTDALADFLAEQCETGPDLTVPVSTLYAAWKTWAAERGAWTMGINRFTPDLLAAGARVALHRPRGEDGRKLPRHYRGVALV